MNDVQKALKQRYAHLHPLLFKRSLEKAVTDVQLFDLLDSIKTYPIAWSEENHSWENTSLIPLEDTEY
jgi:hypothetical protein